METPADLKTVLDQLWRQYIDLTLSRLQSIECAIAAAPDVRAQAAAEAHKLAGSLGSFGLQEATAAARKIESGLLGHHIPESDLRQYLEIIKQQILDR